MGNSGKRHSLNQNARERALLRRFEKDFLYRHVDLLNYGDEQYAAMLTSMAPLMLERQFSYVGPLVRFCEMQLPQAPMMKGYAPIGEHVICTLYADEMPPIERKIPADIGLDWQ